VQGLIELAENEAVEASVRGFVAVEVGLSYINGYGQEKVDFLQAKQWFFKAAGLGFMQAGPLIHRYAKAGGIDSFLDYPESHATYAKFAIQGSRLALEDLKNMASAEIYSDALATLRRELMGVGMGYFLPELFDRFTITDVRRLESQIKSEGMQVDDIGPFGVCEGSLLHFAACSGAADAVTFLLQQGADVNKRTLFGETALLYACRSGHHIVAKDLLKNGADIKLGHYRNGDTPFHWLVNMDEELVEELIKAMPANDVQALLALDAEDANYSDHVQIAFGDGPPLLWAVAYQNTAFIKLLLSLGADPFQESGYTGLSPITLAAMMHLHKILDLLLDKVQPSDVMPNDRPRTPLGVAILSSTIQSRCLAHGAGHTEAMQRTIDVLTKHGASLDNVGSLTRPQTALHAAVSKGALDIVEYLLQHKCGHQVNQRHSRSGYTPLHESILQGFTDVFHLLVKNGGDVSIPYEDGADNLVHTIFVCVRSMRETEAVTMTEYILSDPKVRREAFNSLHNKAPPLALAIEFRQYKLAKCLIDHGADINQEFFQHSDKKSLTMLGHLLNLNRTAEQALSPLRFLLQPAAKGDYEPASFITNREGNESALHTFVSQMRESVDGAAAQAILLYLLSVFGQEEHLEHIHKGVTPLQAAAGLVWYPSFVEILLDHGATANHICTFRCAQLGMTPLDMVLHACTVHPILKHSRLVPEFYRRASQTITILRRRGARRGVELVNIWNALHAGFEERRSSDNDSNGDDIFDLLWQSLGIKVMADFIPMSRALQSVYQGPYLQEHEEDKVFGEALKDAALAQDTELVAVLLKQGAGVSYDLPVGAT
jgi:ankyrin repeat protein